MGKSNDMKVRESASCRGRGLGACMAYFSTTVFRTDYVRYCHSFHLISRVKPNVVMPASPPVPVIPWLNLTRLNATATCALRQLQLHASRSGFSRVAQPSYRYYPGIKENLPNATQSREATFTPTPERVRVSVCHSYKLHPHEWSVRGHLYKHITQRVSVDNLQWNRIDWMLCEKSNNILLHR